MTKRQTTHLDILAVDPVTGSITPVVGEIDVIVHQSTNGRGRKRAQRDRSHPVWGLIDTNKVAKTRLTMTQLRVLFTVADNVNVEDNISRIGPTEIAELCELGQPQNASRALRELKERGFLISEGKLKWRVNPWLYYRGSVADWEEVTALYPEPLYELTK